MYQSISRRRRACGSTPLTTAKTSTTNTGHCSPTESKKRIRDHRIILTILTGSWSSQWVTPSSSLLCRWKSEEMFDGAAASSPVECTRIYSFSRRFSYLKTGKKSTKRVYFILKSRTLSERFLVVCKVSWCSGRCLNNRERKTNVRVKQKREMGKCVWSRRSLAWTCWIYRHDWTSQSLYLFITSSVIYQKY